METTKAMGGRPARKPAGAEREGQADGDWPGPLRWVYRVNTHKASRIFWALSLTAIVIWSFVPSYYKGWDVDVYKAAVVSLRAGHDPYADAMAVQRAYQANPQAYQPGVNIPYSYVYSPMTLPVLGLIARLPLSLILPVYWVIFFVAIGATVWFFSRLIQRQEAATFCLLMPIVIFFPGMLESDCFWSGNVAFILYAAVLLAAWYGWQQGRWAAFYAAVLVTGCFKAPMLSLLAIPVFSARRQWVKAGLAGAVGLALFAVQPLLWPQLFRSYFEAVDLQFRYNRDFSSSPAGLIANALFFHAPYKVVSAVSYLVYGAAIAVALLVLSRRFLGGRITLQQYAPVLLLGTILLNPRVMEYDIWPVTMPVALIVWRVLGRGRPRWQAALGFAVVFAALNVLAALHHVGLSNPPWKLTAGCFLSLTFVAGVWDLIVVSRELTSERESQARVLLGAS